MLNYVLIFYYYYQTYVDKLRIYKTDNQTNTIMNQYTSVMWSSWEFLAKYPSNYSRRKYRIYILDYFNIYFLCTFSLFLLYYMLFFISTSVNQGWIKILIQFQMTIIIDRLRFSQVNPIITLINETIGFDRRSLRRWIYVEICIERFSPLFVLLKTSIMYTFWILRMIELEKLYQNIQLFFFNNIVIAIKIFKNYTKFSGWESDDEGAFITFDLFF